MKTKQIANEIIKVLEKREIKFEVSYTDENIFVSIYKDDYDYSKVTLKLVEGASAEEYVSTVLGIIKDKDYKDKYVNEFKASPTKRFLIDLIKHYDCEEFLYLIGEDLWGDFENGHLPIDDIVDFSYTPCGDVLKLQEDQGGDEYFYTIDFINKTIETRVELLEDIES